MPPYAWSYGGALDAGHGLLGWAQLAVDGLYWLVDVDDHAFEGDRRNLKGHNDVAVDMAHARWATMTAKTALDLCAAELGVRYGNWTLQSEQLPAIGDLKSKQLRKHPEWKLPDLAREWASRVLGDSHYKIVVKEARNPFAHALHVRSASLRSLPAHGHDDRSQFSLGSRIYDTRALILISRDFATRHVEDFIVRRLRGDF